MSFFLFNNQKSFVKDFKPSLIETEEITTAKAKRIILVESKFQIEIFTP